MTRSVSTGTALGQGGRAGQRPPHTGDPNAVHPSCPHLTPGWWILCVHLTGCRCPDSWRSIISGVSERRMFLEEAGLREADGAPQCGGGDAPAPEGLLGTKTWSEGSLTDLRLGFTPAASLLWGHHQLWGGSACRQGMVRLPSSRNHRSHFLIIIPLDRQR